MQRLILLPLFSVGLGLGLGTGCGSPAQHPLTIVSYKDIGCNPDLDMTCTQFYGCNDLSIKDLHVEIGVFNREITTLSCPAEIVSGQSESAASVMVPYQPDQDFYMIDASFTREGSTIYLNAGPFSEDQAQTPWRLVLR